MKRYFQRYRDDPFALTTLQNPDIEVRTYAQLVLATQYAAPLPTRHFLIGRTAIKNARNSPENNALDFSNRLKTANCSARFSRVLRSSNHESRVARHESRFTAHQSLLTDHASLIASERNIKNRRK